MNRSGDSKGFAARRGRRWFLQAAGGSLALAYWLAKGVGRAEGQPGPKRLMILHRPNGCIREDWLRDGQRGPILEPFAPVWEHAVALEGMSIRPGANGNGDPHGRSLVTIMTGAGMSPEIPPGSDDGRWNTTESIDQTWARESPNFNAVPVRSLQVGANGKMSGLQEPQNRTLSYSGAEQPLYPVVDPHDVYARVFSSSVVPGGGTPSNLDAAEKLRRKRESVLAFVRSDLSRVRAQFPAETRADLDIHENAIRELEAQLDGMVSPDPVVCVPPSLAGDLPVGNTHYQDVARVGEAHFALLRAAFVCDLTRMVTFMWGTGASALSFPEFGIGDHHGVSHENDRPALSSAERFFSERTAPFIQSLADTDDPSGGKLIDRTLVWYINENSEGWNHALDDMPFLLFGGAAVGLVNRGRVADVSGTTSNDLWLSIASMFGMPGVRSFETDYTGPIPGLFA
jgi:hypothetical protein